MSPPHTTLPLPRVHGRRPDVVRRWIGALATAILVLPTVSGAQRVVERHDFGGAEGRLIGFYAAALAYSPLGSAVSPTMAPVEFGVEISYVPRLDRAQRTAGFDKPEATNLAPAFPRPRISVAVPGGWRLEGSWIPPVPVFDTRATLGAIAVARPVTVRGVRVVPRLAVAAGRVTASITCTEALAEGSPADALYFGAVCHGRKSRDHFSPRQLSFDVVAARPSTGTGFTPYVGAGVRAERTRFDIGVIRDDGTRDQDHPILELRATRPYALAGARFLPRGRFGVTGELYYAPGSLVTGRAMAVLQLGERR